MNSTTRHGIHITSFGDTVFNFGPAIPIRNKKYHDYSRVPLENVVILLLCRPRMISDIFIYDIRVGDVKSIGFITR